MVSGRRKYPILDAVFGRGPDESSPTVNYQRRQSRLVGSASLLFSGFCIWLVWEAASHSVALGITVAFAILYWAVHYVAAAASDAVFDSLWERTNLQSTYFDVRLDALEQIARKAVNSSYSSKEALDTSDAPTSLSEAFYDYPEKHWHEPTEADATE